MALVRCTRIVAMFGAVVSLLSLFHGIALASDDLSSCCIERVASGDPIALGHALQVPPRVPSLNLTLKITVTVEVRRVTPLRPRLPIVADRRAAPDANDQASATK